MWITDANARTGRSLESSIHRFASLLPETPDPSPIDETNLSSRRADDDALRGEVAA